VEVRKKNKSECSIGNLHNKIVKEENGMLVEVRKLNKREMIVVSSRDVAETFDK